MTGQNIPKPLKEKSVQFGHEGQVKPMIDKILGRCKADRKAIDMLDEDQKKYLKTSAKVFLAARMKKMKERDQ